MNNFTAFKRLTAVAVLFSFLALPALAERNARLREPREPAIVKIVKIAKHLLRISTTGDYPTIPTP